MDTIIPTKPSKTPLSYETAANIPYTLKPSSPVLLAHIDQARLENRPFNIIWGLFSNTARRAFNISNGPTPIALHPDVLAWQDTQTPPKDPTNISGPGPYFGQAITSFLRR